MKQKNLILFALLLLFVTVPAQAQKKRAVVEPVAQTETVASGKVTFTSADISALPPLTQSALADIVATQNAAIAGHNAHLADGEEAQPLITPESYLSTVVNNALDSYTDGFKEKQVQGLRDLGEAMVAAPAEKQAQIQALIEEAKALLGLP